MFEIRRSTPNIEEVLRILHRLEEQGPVGLLIMSTNLDLRETYTDIFSNVVESHYVSLPIDGASDPEQIQAGADYLRYQKGTSTLCGLYIDSMFTESPSDDGGAVTKELIKEDLFDYVIVIK